MTVPCASSRRSDERERADYLLGKGKERSGAGEEIRARPRVLGVTAGERHTLSNFSLDACAFAMYDLHTD